jgi:adenylate cyclase
MKSDVEKKGGALMEETKRRSGGKWRVRITLPVIFITLITATTLFIIFLNYYSTKQSVSAIADDLMTKISEHALEKTLNHLGPAGKLVRLNALSSDGGIFSSDFNKKIEDFTRQQLKCFPQFSMVNFGNERGDFWMTKRMPNGTVSTKIVTRMDTSPTCEKLVQKGREEMPSDTEADKAEIARAVASCIKTKWINRNQEGQEINSTEEPHGCYDPRIRPWYKGAKSKESLFWTDVYVFSSDQKPGITASMPIMKDGQFLGVTTIDIALEELSMFLKKLKIGKNGRAFIINSNGKTVALPNLEEVSKQDMVTGKVKLNTITNISDRAIVSSYHGIQEQMGMSSGQPLRMTQKKSFAYTHDGEGYFGLYMPFPSQYGWDWVIGIIVPENDFMASVKRNTVIGFAISFFCLVCVLLLSVLISRKITHPLDQLSANAEKIRQFELDEEAEVESAFVEITKMADSFENMRTGLKSFGKFVPADLVRYLISSGQEAELGGDNQELTIYFSDIVSFTSISESMPPKKLVVHLGEYLSEMSNIIQENNGTVDKYIGDAVMAFWNAPRRVPNHAYLACRSALQNKNRLRELRNKWDADNLPPFRARIGLNTGDVVVGNMGSEARLNYTVIGDAVNLASRLEAICKMYGVEIVISEFTYALVKDKMVARLLDCVSVKGKKQGVSIYELVAEIGDEKIDYPMDFIETYESAFKLYLDKQWDNATEIFKKADQIVGGGNTSCQLFIERCAIFKSNPPPNDWDGAFVMTTK